jgi:amino acid adenylation domain-containing protein
MQEELTASFRPSPQQEQLWLTEPEGPSGRNQLVALLEGPLDGERLREALLTAVSRHEILRTTFQRRTGMTVPLQVVHQELLPHWDVVDLADRSDEAQTAELGRLADEERGASVALDSGPILRAVLVARGLERHNLILTVPSVFVDASSVTALLSEVAAHYVGPAPADEPLQYADFAEWQHELLDADDADAEQARAYWAALGATPTPAVPFLRSAAQATATQQQPVTVSSETRAAVKAAAEQYGVSGELFVLTAWQVLLGLLSGSNEVHAAVVLPGRQHAELAGAIGAFARPVPVRTTLGDGGLTFAEAVDRVARAAAESTGWQDYRSTGLALPKVGFAAADTLGRIEAEGVAFSVSHAAPAGDGQSLMLSLSEANDDWEATIAHDPAAIHTTQVERLAAQLVRVLETVTERPDVPIDEIELVGDDERQRLLFENNATRTDVPPTTIDAFVREASANRSGETAVVDDAGSIDYGNLDRRVNQLAHRLRDLGVGPGVVVGLCTDRTIDMVVGLLGILRSGGAYLPLHSEHPPARLTHQLTETNAPVIVTQTALVDRFPGFDGELVSLDGDQAALEDQPSTAPNPLGGPDDVVYVMYTSGSTGTPKGVAVTNANLVNYVTHMLGLFEAHETTMTFALVTAISTDLGNTSVFPALCSGGTLSLISPSAAADPGALAARMRTQPADVLKITPSHLNALLAGADADMLPRKWLVLGGEACSWDVVARVRRLSDCRILNHYGPTETTVGSCTLIVDGPGEYAPATVPIGRPITNTACYILDRRGNPAPTGVAGALFIAGAGVAEGYVGQDELTAERFVADPFEAVGGGRMYATGDLARWLPDGTIEFLGRADEQVKIRGFRVEPAEIEEALRRLPAVREAVVVALEEASGEKRLVGYVVSDGSVTTDQLRAHVAEWVPDFMVPSAFALLDELPRTPSGKIDRLALPEPETAAAARTEAFVAPRTPMEENIAAIWADVLNIEKVGVHDDFFALGGHSLLATQIVAQIRTDLSVELPLHSLFSSPTVESLAAAVLELIGEDEETTRLLDELEGLSDEEAAQLLAEPTSGTES